MFLTRFLYRSMSAGKTRRATRVSQRFQRSPYAAHNPLWRGVQVVVVLTVAMVLVAKLTDTRPPQIPNGAPPPTFSAVRLDDLNTTARLDDHRGSVVLLSVWATWCGSCASALVEQDSLVRRFGSRGLRAVGLTVDALRDSTAARHKLATLAPGVEGWLDRDRATQATLQYRGIPKSYLVGRDGRVIAQHDGVNAGHGQVWNNTRGLALIEAALAER